MRCKLKEKFKIKNIESYGQYMNLRFIEGSNMNKYDYLSISK